MCSAILIYTYMHTIYMSVVLIYIINFGGMANENNDILIVIKMTILVIRISSLSTVSICTRLLYYPSAMVHL